MKKKKKKKKKKYIYIYIYIKCIKDLGDHLVDSNLIMVEVKNITIK